MRTSIRIFAGLAIGVVVCFIATSVTAIALGIAVTYFSGHGIATPYLTREFTFGQIRTNGADILLVLVSLGAGVLAMAIWFLATRTSKAEIEAFSGAGMITGADNTPTSQAPSKPPPPQRSSQ